MDYRLRGRAAEMRQRWEVLRGERNERTRRLTVVRGAFSWSDVGGFADLHRVRRAAGGADARGNVL